MYRINKTLDVAKIATTEITRWLNEKPETERVINVENYKEYRSADIDLIWVTKDGQQTTIEIKGDRWHKTGNLFFETHSNLERNTPGCFLYTAADWIYYYFIPNRMLYQLPMPSTREWFIANINNFTERRTRTPVRFTYYTTVGKLVPIKIIMQQCPGVICLQIPEEEPPF